MQPVIICHAEHKKSGSYSVLSDIFTNTKPNIYFDSQNEKVKIISELHSAPKLVVAWQADWWAFLAKALGHHVVIFPMWDSARERPDVYYRAMEGVKSVCFCRRLFTLHCALGLDARYAQFAPDSTCLPIARGWQNPPSVFHWQRIQDELDRSGAIQLLQNWPIGQIHVRPGECLGKPSDHPRAEYLQELSKHQIYLAPRRFEGIGLSFLEAMTMGLCVVAEDQPTHNEYITFGNNGFLFRGDRDCLWPLPSVSVAHLERVGKKARESMVRIRRSWLLKIPKLRRWFEYQEPNRPSAKISTQDLLQLEECTALFTSNPEALYEWVAKKMKTPERSARSASGAARQQRKNRAGTFSSFWKRPRAFFLHYLVSKPSLTRGALLGDDGAN